MNKIIDYLFDEDEIEEIKAYKNKKTINDGKQRN